MRHCVAIAAAAIPVNKTIPYKKEQKTVVLYTSRRYFDISLKSYLCTILVHNKMSKNKLNLTLPTTVTNSNGSAEPTSPRNPNE